MRAAGADLLVVGSGIFAAPDARRGLPPARPTRHVSLERALELGGSAGGRAYPKPTVGAVVVVDGEIVGEGATEAAGRHGEVVALEQAGERARGATLYVTMEPCAHHGTTPPCVDAILAAGVAPVVAGSRDPNPEAGGGLERLREAGVEVEHDDRLEARRQNEAWRTWVAARRPFVIYKVAVTLDGRVTVPGSRWVSGEDSRRLVHELRAAADAVAVGMGTVRLENPRLDARDVAVERQPRRLAFGCGPLPEGSELELRSGSLEDELRALAVGGSAVAPARGRPDARRSIPPSRPRRQAARLRRARSWPGRARACSTASTGRPCCSSLQRPVGDDVLIEAYLREP